MREIRGDAKTIRQLLGGAKYSIDYYQREYKWQTKQVTELLDDLTAKFLDSYEPGDERSEVANYGHYFLGSIIISDKDGKKFIIDGQQRLTTLTLLLIHLYHLLKDSEQRSQLVDMILSQKYGRKSFNLEVDERAACMEAIYAEERFDENGQSESIVNILGRSADIEEYLAQGLQADALPYFVDWLIENVHLVEITAFADEDAYTIFETMNDRGLSLSPTDMLKGYLLSNIADEQKRTHASNVWRERVGALLELGKDEDADGIKSWLRSQHAATIRERKKGAQPQDFDLIGTEFHRWVRNREEALGLKSSGDFATFIERDLAFYGRWYQTLREAADVLTAGMETVHYVAQHNFTLQYPVLLAAVRLGDSEEAAKRKIRLVASYIDIVIHRRIWNGRAMDYSTMQYAMFLVMREIRGRSEREIRLSLQQRLDDEEGKFDGNDRFRLHGMNGRQIHRILVRMTDYIETRSGMTSRYPEYMQRSGKGAYEIEHIWADHSEQHTDEFGHEADFQEYRNRIGGLLVLPKTFNASFGDLPYSEKREHYLKQNLLAQSLHEKAYSHSPGFLRFVQDSGLPFRAHADFRKADLDARQDLYRRVAELIWNPARLEQEASG